MECHRWTRKCKKIKTLLIINTLQSLFISQVCYQDLGVCCLSEYKKKLLLHCGVLYGVENEYESSCKSQKMIPKTSVFQKYDVFGALQK